MLLVMLARASPISTARLHTSEESPLNRIRPYFSIGFLFRPRSVLGVFRTSKKGFVQIARLHVQLQLCSSDGLDILTIGRCPSKRWCDSGFTPGSDTRFIP